MKWNCQVHGNGNPKYIIHLHIQVRKSFISNKPAFLPSKRRREYHFFPGLFRDFSDIILDFCDVSDLKSVLQVSEYIAVKFGRFLNAMGRYYFGNLMAF